MDKIHIIVDVGDGCTQKILSPAYRYLEDAKEHRQTLIDYWFEKMFSEPEEETGLDKENQNHIKRIINELESSFKIITIPLY